MQKDQLFDFAKRYTADAASVAAFYSADGSLSLNDGDGIVQR